MFANQASATPPRILPASVEDARTDDACHISDHRRLAGAAGIPEVGNQHTAAPPWYPPDWLSGTAGHNQRDIITMEASFTGWGVLWCDSGSGGMLPFAVRNILFCLLFSNTFPPTVEATDTPQTALYVSLGLHRLITSLLKRGEELARAVVT